MSEAADVEALVAGILRRRAPHMLLQDTSEEIEDRRRGLRGQLREIDSTLLAKVREAEALLERLETKAADLFAKAEAAQDEATRARFSLSGVRSDYSEARDKIWHALTAIPCDELLAFRREIEGRLANAHAWARTWLTGKIDRSSGTVITTGNVRTLDAYVHALLRTNDSVDAAIRQGLDCAEAQAAISAMRSAWPRVQVGPDEYVVPGWQG